ncbi:MAG: InlB B-repeat-containing protein [Lachnospiraceae bacterium]|nr:InlB B-repeat-containing protein [Lachnospiraceae bacterium]
MDSTCAKTGTKTYKCSRCLKTKTETIAKKSHTFATVTTVQATCTTAGESATKCSQCGYISDTQKIAPLGHDWKLTSTVDSTCAKAGTKTYKCSRCSNTRTETIAKKSHVYQWTTVTAPTEKTVGSEKYACKNCGTVSKTRELYLISFYANGGKGIPANQTKKQGVNLTISSTVPTKDGYTFMGWSAGANSTVILYKPGATCSLDQNLKLYAVWQSKNCTVKYDLNGGKGTLPAAVTVARGATVKVPYTNITRTGYWFLGWAESSTATAAQYKANSEVVANKEVKTLYAVWKIKTFTLSFDANGGTNPPANKTYKYGDTAVVPSTSIKREGYYFMGWNTDPSSTKAPYRSGSNIVMTESVKLYAVWAAQVRTVEFDVNGGTGKLPDRIVSKYDKTVEIGKASVERSGYYFIGWSIDPNARKQEYNSGSKITLKNDLKLYAVWLPKKWQVTFDANGGTGKLPSGFTTETDVWHAIGSATPTKKDYKFIGWSTSPTATRATYSPNGSIRVSEAETGLKNIVLYAVWEHEDCTLTFDLNGGASGAPEKITVAWGSTVKIPKCPNISHGLGKTYFLGWSTKKTDKFTAKDTDVEYVGGDNKRYANTIVLKGNVTLYAVWRHYHTFDDCYYRNGVHQDYCTSCEKWIDGTHNLNTFAEYVYGKNNAKVLTGNHINICCSDINPTTERCGFYEKEPCHAYVKSWKYYHEVTKSDGKQFEVYYRFGLCSECGTLVTDYVVIGAISKVTEDDIWGGIISLALDFLPGKVGTVWSWISEGITGAELKELIDEASLQLDFGTAAFDRMKKLTTSDEIQIAKGYFNPDSILDYADTVYSKYNRSDTTPLMTPDLVPQGYLGCY